MGSGVQQTFKRRAPSAFKVLGLAESFVTGSAAWFSIADGLELLFARAFGGFCRAVGNLCRAEVPPLQGDTGLRMRRLAVLRQ